jgi:hypothetical protein
MNCSTCRYELSLCLDGRLPSGRRTLVLQHAEACAACGTFWKELQAAQQLTLRLKKPAVGEDFREQLWARIRAGEGTPDAVFRDAVPMWAKVRYALSGAAAAALLLAGWSWLQPGRLQSGVEAPAERSIVSMADSRGGAMADGSGRGERSGGVARDAANGVAATGGAANRGTSGGRLEPRAPAATLAGGASSPSLSQLYFDDPVFASTQRLTFDLVAKETAKQLDQRYAAASMGLRRLDRGDDAGALRSVLENVDEFHAFGELLLDLEERRRLYFTDQNVGADLRVAVELLGRSQRSERDLRTVRAVIAPALQSNRLAAVSRMISLVPPQSPREDLDVLQHLNLRRPEVFPMLFIVLNNEPAAANQIVPNAVIAEDECGEILVAPRSAVEGFQQQVRVPGFQFRVQMRDR